MRNLIWLVLLFVVAVVAASTLGLNDGLVSVYWRGWRTDLSLNLFILVSVGAGLLIGVFVRGVRGLVRLPQRARSWRAQQKERAAGAALREGLINYFGARYGRAQKAAQRSWDLQATQELSQTDPDFRCLTQLLVAGSLHRLQDRARRDEALRQALQGASREAGEAVRLQAAEWALEDRDAQRALEMLASLQPGAARRTQALRLRLQAQRMARQPLDALQTCRLLAKHQAFSPLVAQSLLRSLAAETLETVHDAQQLRRLWTQLDAADRRDPVTASRAALRAVQLDASEDARQWLRPFWDTLPELAAEDRESVALALIEARAGITPDWLPRLESAEHAVGQEPVVLAAVGTVYAERRLWGKARSLLEQAVASQTLPARARRICWRLLAELARQQGDADKAAACDRAAAAVD